jgi:hypothetical protein
MWITCQVHCNLLVAKHQCDKPVVPPAILWLSTIFGHVFMSKRVVFVLMVFCWILILITVVWCMLCSWGLVAGTLCVRTVLILWLWQGWHWQTLHCWIWVLNAIWHNCGILCRQIVSTVKPIDCVSCVDVNVSQDPWDKRQWVGDLERSGLIFLHSCLISIFHQNFCLFFLLCIALAFSSYVAFSY